MSAADLVIVGMSGGVDSTLAAALLLERGRRVEGLFMSNWEEDEDDYCTAARDYQDARRICQLLAIPLHRVSFAGEYRERVFRHFLAEYAAGRTPNPDVSCNREIKFGVCLEFAKRLGAATVATGHYARVDSGEHVRLLRGVDRLKDQSYFLHTVPGVALAQALFPIGHLRKEQVRAMVRERGLPVFDKQDSTGICFIGERPFADFLARYLPAQPGDIVTEDGKRLGRHRGLMFYTLGQRQGLGIGGCRDAGDAPWYVADKNLTRNELVVVQGHDHPALMSEGLEAVELCWVAGAPPGERFRCTARTRYRQPDQPCKVEMTGAGCRVRFEQAQRAVTPGQSVVFYLGEECLGGGTISARVTAAATPTAVSA